MGAISTLVKYLLFSYYDSYIIISGVSSYWGPVLGIFHKS